MFPFRLTCTPPHGLMYTSCLLSCKTQIFLLCAFICHVHQRHCLSTPCFSRFPSARGSRHLHIAASPTQRFSAGGDFAQRRSGNVISTCGCHVLGECYWHLGAGGQGCGSVSCHTQMVPTVENYPALNVHRAAVEKLLLRTQSSMSSLSAVPTGRTHRQPCGRIPLGWL